MISSRTPEGWFHRCAVCGREVRVEPSVPTRDAPCPHCGSPNWFVAPDEFQIEGDDIDQAVEVWEAAGRPRRVVVDFENEKFIDSGHLGRLILLHQRLAQEGARMRLVGLNSELLEVFRLTKLDRMIDMEGEE